MRAVDYFSNEKNKPKKFKKKFKSKFKVKKIKDYME